MSASASQEIEVPAPPPSIEDPPPTLARAFLRIGPGLILAGAIVGTGELIATTNLGARAGYSLLWLVILSCFIKVFAQVELGRHAISSGEASFESFRSLPGPGVVLVWWCALMVLVTEMQIGAMIGGIAEAVHLALSVSGGDIVGSQWPWAVLVTAVTIAMLATGSYSLVEWVSTGLVVGFTFMTVVCVVFLPGEHAISLSEAARGLSLRLPDSLLVPAFTMFGITGVGASELLAYPYWCIEKGYARSVGPRDSSDSWAFRARGWMRVLRLDAWVSMAIYLVSTLSFYLLGASVLHRTTGGQGLPDEQVVAELAKMYAPVMGTLASTWFIVAGAIAVLYSTLFAATAGNGRILTDFLRVTRRIDPDSEAARLRWVRILCAVLPAAACGLYLTVGNLVLMVTVGGVMQGLSLPFIGGAAVYMRYRRTDRRITPGLVWDIFLWISLLGLTAAATYSLWKELGRVRMLLG